jgi:hypothetical protein
MHLKKRWIDRRVYEYFAVNIGPLLGWHDPILIYQMGGVGSSSIRNSLFRSNDPRTRLVLMCHEFFPIRNRDLDRIVIEPEYRGYLAWECDHDRRVFEQFSLARRLSWLFRKKFYTQRIYQAYVKAGGQLRVITIVRDPMAHNISLFFQVFDQYAGTSVQQSGCSVDELIRIFLERYVYSRPLTWFDAELKTTLGIDVFQHPFPVERGYAVVAAGDISLLVLRSELEDRQKADAIAKFLGLKDFKILRSNVTSEKAHGPLYEEFKRCIRVPDDLLKQLYESKYARHFYSDEERARLRARWRGDLRNQRSGQR